MAYANRQLSRSDLIDELEAAVTLHQSVEVWLRDQTRQDGLPLDLITHDHEDFLFLADHTPIPVTDIYSVVRI